MHVYSEAREKLDTVVQLSCTYSSPSALDVQSALSWSRHIFNDAFRINFYLFIYLFFLFIFFLSY